VILVDASLLHIKSLTKILGSIGFLVSSFSSAQRAIDFMKNSEIIFSLVLVDIVLPEMDGLSMLKAIKNDNGISSVPVIIMYDIPVGETELRKSCRDLGAFDVVKKPLDLLKLRTMLEFLNIL
jgi:DNA-binding response OmpR family regulator